MNGFFDKAIDILLLDGQSVTCPIVRAIPMRDGKTWELLVLVNEDLEYHYVAVR